MLSYTSSQQIEINMANNTEMWVVIDKQSSVYLVESYR